MKKRIISLLVAATMLLGLMPILGVSVAADTRVLEDLTEWTPKFYNKNGLEGESAQDGEKRIFKLAKGESYDGSDAMYIRYESAETLQGWGGYANNGVGAQLNNLVDKVWSWEANTEYQISFIFKAQKIAGATHDPFIKVFFGDWTKNQTNDTSKISSDGLTEEQIADGWKKYRTTYTTTTTITNMDLFNIQMPGEYWIDDISLMKTSDKTELISNGSFKGLKYTDGVEGWFTQTSGAAEVTTNKLQTVSGIGRNDDTCMYVEFDSKATDNGTWGFGNDALTLYNNLDTFDKNKTYTVSLWIKGDISFSNSSYIWMGDNNASTGADTDKNKFQFNKLHSGAHVNASFGEWTQITATISGATKRFALRFQCDVPGLYIDDVSLVANDDTTKTNLLTNGEIAPKEEEIEPDPEPTPGLVYTDGVEDWVLEESIKDGQVKTKKFQTVTGMGHGDDSCMYIEFESSAPNNNTWGYSNDAVVLRNTYRGFDKTNYTLSMWVKGKIGFANSAYIKMGGNQCGKNGYTAETANRYQMSYAVNQTKDAVFEDWTQISLNFTGTTEHFNIWFQTAIGGLYIDDITLTATADTTNTNLIVNGAMLPAEEDDGGDVVDPEPEPTPDAVYTDGVKGWFTETVGSAKVTTNKLQTVTGIGRNDSSCMYLQYDSEATDNKTWGFGNDALILYNDLDTFDKNKTYTVSLWIKGDIAFSNSSYIWMGDNNASTGADTDKNKFQFNKLHSGAHVNASFGEWTQITATISGATKRFALRFQTDVPGFYIDDVSLVANDDSTKTNLLVNGDVEEMYQQEWDAVYTDGVDNWNAVPNNTTADVLTQKLQTVTGMGHDSYSCMYLEFDSAATDNKTWGYSSDTFLLTNAYDGFDSAKTYTLTMWIKGVVGFSNSVFIDLGNNMANSAADTGMNKWKLSTLTNTQVNATFADWTKVSMKLTNPEKAFNIRFQCDVPGLYIDDISLVADDDATGTNLLSNGSFDKVNEDGFYAYKANIYDAEDNIITKLTTAQSGAKLTSVATVVNYSCEDDYTAQLITCIYDDERLVKTAMSAKTDIPAVGEKALLQNEIKLPEFTEVGNLTVRTYIWDSVKGMIPLQEEVGEI